MKPKTRKWLYIVILAIILALLAVMVYDLFPLFQKFIENRNDETKTVSYINAYGAKGVPIIAALQMLQVVVAFFPAAPIQVLAGLCYGIWKGTLICLTGYIAGNILVFFLFRQFQSRLSSSLMEKQVPSHKRKASKWLNVAKIKQMKHPEVVAFFLYLLPGIPNGMLPYLFAQTSITFLQYLASITMASVPSMLIYAWIGKNISQGKYWFALILALLLILILLAVLLFRNKIFLLFDKRLGKKTAE